MLAGNIATLLDDLTGQHFGKLTVVGIEHVGVNGAQFWQCDCECGESTVVPHALLVGKGPRSCGCIRSKHGLSRTRTYRIWRGMMDRCHNPNSKHFPGWGGRGIKVCDRWKRFRPFLEDMGIAPEGLQIDRVDNDGDYCPENCRWATRTEQMKHTRQTRSVTFQGKTQCLKDWSRELGFSFRALHARLSRGWSVEEAFTKPASRSNPRKKL